MASSDDNKKPRPDSWLPAPDSAAMPPSSWAKRTGFRPKFSGETNASESGPIPALTPPRPPVQAQLRPKQPETRLDLEAGRPRPDSTSNGDAVLDKDMAKEKEKEKEQTPPVRKRRDSDGGKNLTLNGQPAAGEGSRKGARYEEAATVDMPPQFVLDDDGVAARPSHMKYELRDTPGLVPIGLYGFQHFISMLGSLILIPLVIVPAMGGTYEDTADVVSTVLFISGVTTLLHVSFGSRLPLIQGPSYVFLAPALAVINSPEFMGLNRNNFKHIMKELQGAIIIGSAFQAFLGYSGLMKIFLRLINPVVVAPTIASVGLSFFSYGFPRVGTCIEIGVLQILLVVILSLYLRKISVFGHRLFLIYAVPLGLFITWCIAFLLTESGVYNYKGCDINTPSSNIISDNCRRHVSRMKSCRVDTNQALSSSPWFRCPYPLQWGMPVFHWKMALVMCAVSIIASVDSGNLHDTNPNKVGMKLQLMVGSYHASSLLVASRPPTPGVLSRGIGLEGLTSILAGLWGMGTGSTTLTENVHTIAVTKMGSRRAVDLGACVMIVLSLVGKVGGFIASIPEVMVAALLCFMWAMLTALGLSNLRYSEAGSSRNIIIVGLSLFFSLSVPAYFQQYGISPNSNLSVPSYFQPYIVASHGPIHTKSGGNLNASGRGVLLSVLTKAKLQTCLH
ncbi:Nucleobase-ascorbate transporter 12 [Orobanche minor]